MRAWTDRLDAEGGSLRRSSESTRPVLGVDLALHAPPQMVENTQLTEGVITTHFGGKAGIEAQALAFD